MGIPLVCALIIGSSWLVSPCSFLVSNLPPTHYANSVQAKRGPDHTSQVKRRGHHFVHNLLHMTGGTMTPQPFEYYAGNRSDGEGTDDPSVVTMYNGEIYNAEDFSTVVDPKLSDGSCLVPSYQAHGPTFPQKLDGEFAIVLFDYDAKVVVLATDTFGTKPLFYYVTETHFIVSSYRSTITRLLSFYYLPTSADLIHQLPPNTIRTFRLSSQELNPIPGSNYDIPTTTFDVSSQNKNTTADFVSAFKSAVLKRSKNLRTSPFVGLSSGYDSGAIACALASSGVAANAYTVSGNENLEVVNDRLDFMSSRQALLSNATINMDSDEYLSQQAELFVLCEKVSKQLRAERQI